ncbi:MAG: hypothetical protein IPM07_28270 [Anaerolineales bacterium]|nr:hypothetical protein [Anaerolineales bacterium]
MMQHRSSHSCVIFADDLTGANDTGVQFARVGLRTRVSFDASQTAALDASDILVIDTDSRVQARRRLSTCVRSRAFLCPT